MVSEQYNKWRMAKVKTIGYCTFCLVLVGFVMLLAGAIISGIAYTEVRPNVADENYERYIRSDIKRVIGPILLSFGFLCIISGCVFFGCNLFSASRDNRRAKQYANARLAHGPFPPGAVDEVEKQKLSDV